MESWESDFLFIYFSNIIIIILAIGSKLLIYNPVITLNFIPTQNGTVNTFAKFRQASWPINRISNEAAADTWWRRDGMKIEQSEAHLTTEETWEDKPIHTQFTVGKHELFFKWR